MLWALKQRASDWMWLRSVERNQSRGEWRTAPKYTAYHQAARRKFAAAGGGAIPFPDVAAEYAAKGFASMRTPQTAELLERLRERVLSAERAGQTMFGADCAPFEGPGWSQFPELEALLRGDLGGMFRSVFGSEFKVSHGYVDRKVGGSHKPKFWHSDSGPGTCLNVFCYFGDGFAENGPTNLLPWPLSLEIFREEKAFMRRALSNNPTLEKDKAAKRACLAEFYADRIARQYPDRVESPSGPVGTIVLFNNNVLHSAQPPAPGKERLTLQMRVYPSDVPPDFERYARYGLKRKLPYPEPDAVF